ncbi:MAG: hypothetical protein ACK5LT_12155 [Lachnospirales bacterium]
MYRVNETEVLKYLGYSGQELDEINRTNLKKAKNIILNLAKPKYIYRKFGINHSGGIKIEGTSLVLEGKDIYNHLVNCKEIYLLGATLGNDIDKEINKYQILDLNLSLYLDACASTLIEEVCDIANLEINKLEENTIWRFSCGYGDLPMEIQPKIINILNATKLIGLTCSSTNIMIPRKSVTAIIGVGIGQRVAPCQICKIKDTCEKRKAGNYCGKSTK